MKGQSPILIKENLEAQCYRKENKIFRKPLSEEELQAEEKSFVADNIQLSKLKDDLEDVKEEFKAKIKPVEKALSMQLDTLKTRSKEVEEEIYLIDDQDAGTMGYYDKTGRLIDWRRLLPDERQMSIHKEAAAV